MKFILIADDTQPVISFFSKTEFLGFIAVVLFAFFAFFPRHLLQVSLAENTPSAVTLSYLQAFFKQYPQNKDILFALIEQEMGMGQLQEAKRHLMSLKETNSLVTPMTKAELSWLDYLMIRYEAYETKPNTESRINGLRQLREKAKSLLSVPLNPRQLTLLANDSLGIGKPEIALKIYQLLLGKNELTTPKELSEGASIAMQNNDEAMSAKFYWAAYQKSVNLSQRRHYAMKALQALWAGNQVKEALSIAQHLPKTIIADRKFLLFLSRLAIAANDALLAEKYALAALEFEPSDKHE